MSSAIVSSSSDFSLSSSSLLYFVSRRSGISRMYSACTWLRSNTVDQALARLPRVVAAANDRDDLVDVEDRDEQALDEVQAVGGLARR